MRVLAAALAVMAILLACGSDEGTPDITVMLQFPDGGRVPVTMTPSEKFNDQVIGVVPLPPSTSAGPPRLARSNRTLMSSSQTRGGVT